MLRPLAITTTVLDMSPATLVPMGGFGGRERLTRKVDGRLEANVVALGEGESAVVLVSLDLLFAGAELAGKIVAACGARFGIGPERVLVLASHTHFAPMLDSSKPRLGRTDPTEAARWADVITSAIAAAPVRQATGARVGRGRSDSAVNRRLRWRWPTARRILGKATGDIYLCDNPDGPRDPEIRTCVWQSAEGAPLAAFWSFACHPVFMPDAETASADYVGVVRERLRQSLGAAELPVIFAPGCMGDVWPRSPGPWKTLARAPQLALYGPHPLQYDRPSWDAWAHALAGEVAAIDKRGATTSLEPCAAPATMTRLPLAEVFDGRFSTDALHGKAVTVPGVGRVIALGCEPVSDIAMMVAKPGELVLGYEGEVFGYLPTAAMVREGGYEPRGSLAYFGLDGVFRPDLDDTIRAFGRKLADAG